MIANCNTGGASPVHSGRCHAGPASNATAQNQQAESPWLNRLGLSRIKLFGRDVSKVSLLGREVYQAPNRQEATQVDNGPSVKSVKIFGKEVDSIKLFGREIFSKAS